MLTFHYSDLMFSLIGNADVLHSFSTTELIGINEPLKSTIENAYSLSLASYGTVVSNKDNFKKSLMNNLPIQTTNLTGRKKKDIMPIWNYIEKDYKDCFCFDNYEAFVDSLVEYCYEPLKNKQLSKVFKNQILEQFSKSLDSYLSYISPLKKK